MNFNLKSIQKADIDHSPSSWAITVNIACLMLVTLAVITAALPNKAQAANNEGWFDIEVIFLEQLGDKSKLKEIFNTDKLNDKETPSATLSDVTLSGEPKSYKPVKKKKAGFSSAYVHKKNVKTLNLLEDYVAPNFQTVKQAMPVCSTSELPFNEQDASQEHFYQSLNTQFLNAVRSLHNTNIVEQVQKRPTDYVDTNIENNVIDSPKLSFEQAYNDYQFAQSAWIFHADTLPSAKHISGQLFTNTAELTPKTHCVWSKTYFDYTQQFSAPAQTPMKVAGYYDYQLNSMPTKINGAEHIGSESPYLLSDQSLTLQPIVQELKKSRNFKPLMHFGWRQYTVNKRRATPLKVMAGENLFTQYTTAQRNVQHEQAIYQQALKAYKSQVAYAKDAEHAELTTLLAQQNEQLALAVAQKKSSLIQTHLDSIYEQVSDQPPAMATLAEQVNMPALYNNEAIHQALANEYRNNMPSPPLFTLGDKPLQRWHLEGLLTVHVSHYLHITADFNIMNRLSTADDFLVESTESKKADTTNKQSTLYPIRFKQDRRVISKEIHYFDHPYMGMIVQIRRYTPPEEPTEEITDKLAEGTQTQ